MLVLDDPAVQAELDSSVDGLSAKLAGRILGVDVNARRSK